MEPMQRGRDADAGYRGTVQMGDWPEAPAVRAYERSAAEHEADQAFLLALLRRSRRSRGEIMLSDFELAIVEPALLLRRLQPADDRAGDWPPRP